MLHEFLTSNREELVKRCRSKVNERDSPPVTLAKLQYGVPLFLGQLIEGLRYEESSAPRKESESPWRKSPGAMESSRTAALHGKELLDQGYTVEQVVHSYGDICQAITELAAETSAPITVDEFHTFNRLLDNAIADAVASFGKHTASAGFRNAEDLHGRLGTLADQQRVVLQTALDAFAALRVGNLGLRGATGALLEDSLKRLRNLVDQSLPEIRLATGMTTPPRA